MMKTKKLFGKSTGKMNKGAPSGFLISVIFHAAAFFIAGLFVVFTVVNKSEPEFQPPPALERPKMKLKKPKVKVRKSSQPKPSSRIIAKVKTQQMPEIQLPDLMGSGEGLMGGLGFGGGDFLDLPDIKEIDVFGSTMSIGNDFEGVFYDLKRYRSGKGSSMGSRYAGGDEFVSLLYKFLKSKMDPAVLNKYYRSPKKLYTTAFAMPPNLSLMAPTSFGCPETLGCLWLVHYKGVLVYPKDIKFRFRAAADDIVSVMIDGEYVVQSMTWSENGVESLMGIWYKDPVTYYCGLWPVVVGDWIELKAGVPRDMQVVMAEIPGGNFQAILCVEVDGVDYPLNDQGGPILPIFKTAPVSRDLADVIHSMSVPDDFCVTNGPVFSDFESKTAPVATNETAEVAQNKNNQDTRGSRIWTSINGKTIEGTLIALLFDTVSVKTSGGETVKLPLKDLSEEDRKYVSLENNPEFKIKFITGRNHIAPPEQPPDTWYRPITINEYHFGLEVAQKTSGDYPYPLTIEYFAIADETDGKNYRLLEHCASTFTPSKENNRSHTFRGKKLRTQQQTIIPETPMRGYDYCGYLVVITDMRGKVIQYDETRKFLYSHLDALRKLKPGDHFNEQCQRVTPARPKDSERR